MGIPPSLEGDTTIVPLPLCQPGRSTCCGRNRICDVHHIMGSARGVLMKGAITRGMPFLFWMTIQEAKAKECESSIWADPRLLIPALSNSKIGLAPHEYR